MKLIRAFVKLNNVKSIGSLIDKLELYTDPDDWVPRNLLDIRRRLDRITIVNDFTELDSRLDALGELIDTMF